MDPEVIAAMPSNPNENKGPLVAGVVAGFLGMIYLSTSLRIYVRCSIQRQWGWDDNLMIGASIFFSALSGMIFWGVHQGMGKHILDLKPEAITKAILAWYVSEILYSFCITMVKVSIGIFLLRIAVKRVHRIILISTTVANFIMGVIFLGFVVFQCKPIDYFWLRALNDGRPGYCTNTVGPIDLVYVYSAINVLIDLTYAVLPAFMVWDLQMPGRTKFLIAGILGMGTVGSMGLLIRIPYLAKLGSNYDFLYNTTNVAIWSVVEPGLGIVAGSLATLRPLLLAWQRGSKKGTSSAEKAGYHSSSRRPYLSHTRRLGSDEQVLGASGSRDAVLTGNGQALGDVSLEKLDLEGNAGLGIGSMTRITAASRTERWSKLPFPEADGLDDEAYDAVGQDVEKKIGAGVVEVRVAVRQSVSDAPIRRSSLADAAEKNDIQSS